jgi:Ankyrin repeats (many copies)
MIVKAHTQVGNFHPRGVAVLASFTLSEAQLVIAPSFGFASWPRLKEYLHLEGLRLMAELGFEMTGMTAHDRLGMSLNTTPLHNAAWKGNLGMVKVLLELGADPGLRDPTYDGTPLDWAAHNQQEHVVEYLNDLERP